MTGVFVLGGHQTDFARNVAKEGLDISAIVEESVLGALGDARLEPCEVGVIHLGNAFGELFNGQSQLGALPATVVPELWGVPATRHEAACASGGVAVLAAMADIEAGRYDVALVVGAEQQRNVAGREAAAHLAAAAHVGHEADGVPLIWPHMFNRLAELYDERFGLDDIHLHAIAELNTRNAKDNPKAQTRAWSFSPESFSNDNDANPVVEGRVRRTDCSQITDGGVGLVLASRRFTEAWAAHRGVDPAEVARIDGWGHRTVALGFDSKLEYADTHVYPHLRATIRDAFDRARVEDVGSIDGIETHDCFTPSEYAAIDHFGITKPGAAWQAIEDGRLERDGDIPINPSGGLIGIGHPVGTTGVRMVLDAASQVTGRAGACQVEGARRFATLNIGGSATTAVSFVVASAAT